MFPAVGLVCMSTLFMIGSGGNLDAQVVANFSGGTGTTGVDQWTGAAGSGWTGGWTTGASNASDVTFSGEVKSDTPLSTGGGSYLSFSYARNAGTSGNRAGFSRQVSTTGESAAVDLTQAYTVSFQLRFDSLTGWGQTSDQIYISMEASDAVAKTGNLGGNTTGVVWGFYIQGRSQGTRWNFADGDSSYEQLTWEIETEKVYTFQIDAFPNLASPTESFYNISILLEGEETPVVINDLQFRTTTTSGDLGTRWNSANHFGARISMDANDAAILAFDNFSISQIPEPTSFSLLGLGACGWLFLRRK